MAWVFFRADTVGEAWGYLSGMMTHSFMGGFKLGTYALSFVLIAILISMEWMMRGEQVFNFRRPILRYSSYSMIVGLILFYGVFFNPQDFIYFQF